MIRHKEGRIVMLSIRKMKLKDKIAVMDMVDVFYNSDAVLHGVGMDVLERSFMDAVGLEPSVQGAVLCEEEEIVGFAYMAMTYSCEAGGKSIMLEELYLKEQCRGKGYGRKFFNWMFDSFPEIVRFRLEVTSENEGATALYKSLGFEDLEYNQMIYDRSL